MQLEVHLHGGQYKSIHRQELKQRLGEVHNIQALLLPFM